MEDIWWHDNAAVSSRGEVDLDLARYEGIESATAQTPSNDPRLVARGAMIVEAQRIIDAAREQGIVLRAFGGLAVRMHCQVIGFCERDYSDLDMVGLAGQFRQIVDLMKKLGYRENVLVGQATEYRQLQFFRRCEHVDAQAHFFVHPDDHVDVFLDTFRMDHDIPLKDRLTLDHYTISVTDTLLTKLQIYRLNEKDLRDILTLVKELELGDDDAPDVIDVPYMADCCARDWGLYHDVMTNLELCRRRVGDYNLSAVDLEHVQQKLGRLAAALEATPKPRSWRARAKVGTRRPWHNELEEQG
jgi:hypothetical protein